MANVNVNTFLSLNQIKLASFSNSSELPSLEWRFASVSFSSGVSLNISNQVVVKRDLYDSKQFSTLNDEFVDLVFLAY